MIGRQHQGQGKAVRRSCGQGSTALGWSVIAFSMWFFSPRPKAHLSIDSCFDLFALRPAVWRARLQTPQSLLRFMGEQAAQTQGSGAAATWRLRTSHSAWPLILWASSGRTGEDADVEKNVPRESGGFCCNSVYKLTLTGAKQCWAKDT